MILLLYFILGKRIEENTLTIARRYPIRLGAPGGAAHWARSTGPYHNKERRLPSCFISKSFGVRELIQNRTPDAHLYKLGKRPRRIYRSTWLSTAAKNSPTACNTVPLSNARPCLHSSHGTNSTAFTSFVIRYLSRGSLLLTPLYVHWIHPTDSPLLASLRTALSLQLHSHSVNEISYENELLQYLYNLSFSFFSLLI